MRRTVLSLGAVVSLVVSGFTVAMLAGPAAAYEDYAPVRNVRLGLCANDEGTIRLRSCAYTDRPKARWSERFRYRNSNGYAVIQLKNKKTGKCLGAGDRTKGATVYSLYCRFRDGTVNPNTKWVAMDWHYKDDVKLRLAGTGNCVGVGGTSGGAPLKMRDCDPDAKYQWWRSREFLEF